MSLVVMANPMNCALIPHMLPHTLYRKTSSTKSPPVDPKSDSLDVRPQEFEIRHDSSLYFQLIYNLASSCIFENVSQTMVDVI